MPHEFDELFAGLGCDAVFGFWSQKVDNRSWAEYRSGRRVHECLYVGIRRWTLDGKEGIGDQPPEELDQNRIFAAHGREFTSHTFATVLSDYCALPAERRPPFRLVEIRTQYGPEDGWAKRITG